MDSWSEDYDSCSRLGHEIMENIETRNALVRGSSAYTRKTTEIQSSMSLFSQGVNKLRDDLIGTASSRRLTQREVERRQIMMDQITTQEHKIQVALRENSRAADRSALMGSSNPFHSEDPWDAPASSNPFTSPNTNAFYDSPTAGLSQIRQQQQQAIREQDEGLDALSSVLSRQKQMALDIGNEVDGQNALIDDIHDHTERTNQRITQETRHVLVIDRKSNTCWMWVIIVLLIIAIIVVAFVPVH